MCHVVHMLRLFTISSGITGKGIWVLAGLPKIYGYQIILVHHGLKNKKSRDILSQDDVINEIFGGLGEFLNL